MEAVDIPWYLQAAFGSAVLGFILACTSVVKHLPKLIAAVSRYLETRAAQEEEKLREARRLRRLCDPDRPRKPKPPDDDESGGGDPPDDDDGEPTGQHSIPPPSVMARAQGFVTGVLLA